MPEPIEPSARRMAEAVEARYREGETDYWLSPLVLVDRGRPVGRISAGDAVLFCCRRG
ncbi:phosphoglycerate mutase (2,3-diphosphoglycerate-independent), partial [Candidatus Bipolaricaulota bacterium]|nr:phosphoglycerate mutase (2,3-diphosphoglycerate-independent) [Candidatus Bipolaricaulota bacterium]